MKVLAIVVAFNPNLSDLRINLNSFSPEVDRILLWRNSPIEFDYPNAEMVGDCTNRGIPEAFNYAWHYAEEHGYDWLLTMDQDSKWVDFHGFLQLALNENAPDGVYTPRFMGDDCEGGYIPVMTLINSGTLQRVSHVRMIGGWSNDFFLDAVDTDYYIRARIKGISIYKLTQGHLIHHMGEVKMKNMFGKVFTTMNYSPNRLYYIFRNHWIVIKRYPGYIDDLKKSTIESISFRIPRILLGEKNKLSKIGAILRGTLAGCFYKAR